jgi:hypothetical protein
MPSVFTLQATNNQKFLDSIEEKFPEIFLDWKITVMFYIALHLMKELAEQYHVDVGRSHESMDKALNPETNNPPQIDIPIKIWRTYRHLYQYSKNHRYDGYLDDEIFNFVQISNYEAVKVGLEKICTYMKEEQNIVH